MSFRIRVLNILRKCVPVLPLTVQFTLTKIVFNTCDSNNYTEEQLTGFWIYFPILCLICITWEAFYAYTHYTEYYPHSRFKQHLIYTIISTIISFLRK